MTNNLLELIKQYGNAEHNQDDGQAIYFLSKIETALSDAESGDTLADVRKVRQMIYEISGSALLAGEKCKPEDKEILYGIACRANNLLGSVEDELAVSDSVAVQEPAIVTSAMMNAGADRLKELQSKGAAIRSLQEIVKLVYEVMTEAAPTLDKEAKK